MKKIRYKDLVKELIAAGIGLDRDSITNKEKGTPFLGVYHCHEWDHGYETWYGYNGSRREFYADMREMTEFIIENFSANCIYDVIIAPFYRYNQFDNRYYNSLDMPGADIFKEIRRFLLDNKVGKGSRAGVSIPVKGNIWLIEMILEGAFRGVSELCLFSTEQKLLIAPTHHFELVFWTQEFNKERDIIKSILPKYPNLVYYDMNRADYATKQ